MFLNDSYEDEDFSGRFIDTAEISRKKFTECRFTGSDFTEVPMIYGCTFDQCSFSSAKLNGVEMRNCVFLNCNFRFAVFFATIFDDCKMTGSSLLDTDASFLTINGGDWSYTDLRYLQFEKKTLEEVVFTGADLTGAKFLKCRMDRCDFNEVTAEQLSFRDSDIRGSFLGNLDLLAVELKNTKVDLSQCVAIAEAVGAKFIP